jgi:hypothetical protein
MFSVFRFRLWCRTDDGKTYRRYVDIASKGISPVVANPPGFGWSSDVLDQLYRSQRAFERNPDIYGPPIVNPDKIRELEQPGGSPSIIAGFKARENLDWQSIVDWGEGLTLPTDPNNPNRQHIGGPGICWCERTHPPHKSWQEDCDSAPLCWCLEKHCGIGYRW